MKVAIIILVGIIAGIIILELALRRIAGFGKPLIYISDPEIGYLLAPSQKTRRLGNSIEINRYSMRSPEITLEPSESTLRILLLGDSIVNGGWWTDQADILSVQIQQQLTTDNTVEVLNMSANSWGPPNQLAYLQKHGIFQAEIIVLVINTDDLFSKIPNPLIVGRDRNYPDKLPPFALWEFFSRYFGSTSPVPEPPQPEAVTKDPVGFNLDKITKIKQHILSENAQFLLAMTPLLREIGESGPRDYEVKARQRLTALTEEENITFIDFLPLFNQIPNSETLYRDHIHLSVSGNQIVSQKLSQQLKESFNNLPNIRETSP
ncbi:MAG: SGNH/GDSL hydrolase family protein [Microcoleaceae cyanobacterium]